MLLNKINESLVKETVKLFIDENISSLNLENIVNPLLMALKEDEKQYEKYGVTLLNPSAGLYALMFYRLQKIVFLNYLKQADPLKKFEVINKIKNYCLKEFSCYINPLSSVDTGVVINGVNILISENVVIKSNCVIYSNVNISSSNNVNKDKNNIFIDKNCVIFNNAIIYGSVNIGENSVIKHNVIVRENIPSNCTVEIVNQLQIKNEKVSKLPSQNTIIYGLTRKFKNTIIIYGEGFYNPKIIIRSATKKEIPHELYYWDKNKIIIKIKYANYSNSEVNGSYLVLMSNGNKLTLLNNFALEKALLNLCE